MRKISKVWLSCIAALVLFGMLVTPKETPPAPGAVPKPAPTPSPAPSPSAAATETAGVTRAQYAAVKTGMTYAEVVKLIGEGEEQSSNNIAGADTVMYTWDGAAWGSSMNAIIQNGKLVQKSQFGLR